MSAPKYYLVWDEYSSKEQASKIVAARPGTAARKYMKKKQLEDGQRVFVMNPKGKLCYWFDVKIKYHAIFYGTAGHEN